MNVVILAAGVSRRLYPLTYDQPKCLLDVGGKAIIDHQIQALQESGLNRIIVVVGYYRERLMKYLQSQYSEIDFRFIVNHHFFETNTAYSVYLCREEFENGPFILMNADVLYP
ncbi:MAG: NTP transferase domain-containing protein, partial [FCB group bacterium]|nr:NTP transferase domain-containing protein [FCB group bacterium]